ncbi:MAG: 50S ribosomal protein L35 [Candidatus Blackburnbacteria bacterium]|nr:50S ribosomal protein L35 [Candidatus Blackburnbacteria bacterium]
MKIKKSVARRIRITGSGKLLRRRGFGRHLKTKKSKGQKRSSRRAILIKGALEKKLRKVLGI